MELWYTEDLLEKKEEKDISTDVWTMCTGIFIEKIGENTTSYSLMTNNQNIFSAFEFHDNRFKTSDKVLIRLKYRMKNRCLKSLILLLHQDNDSKISIDHEQKIHQDNVQRFLDMLILRICPKRRCDRKERSNEEEFYSIDFI